MPATLLFYLLTLFVAVLSQGPCPADWQLGCTHCNYNCASNDGPDCLCCTDVNMQPLPFCCKPCNNAGHENVQESKFEEQIDAISASKNHTLAE